MAKVGRPPKFDAPDIAKLVEKFEQYIEETELPIVAEFAYQNGLGKQFMIDRAEFSDLVKRCLTKKEAALERGLMQGRYNAAGAIFSLKQLGWSDKQQVEHQGTVGLVRIEFADPNKRIEVGEGAEGDE